MDKLKEKVAVITGGNSGIGLAVAKKMASRAVNIVLVDYNEASFAAARDEILHTADVEVDFIKTDVSKEEDVKKAIEFTVQKYGKVDYLFNNAGIEGERKEMEEYSSEVYQRVLNINVNGVFFGMKYALKYMKEQGFGVIVNTASALGIRGSRSMAAYVASKHAVVGLTKVGAIEGGPHNVRVCAIAPGGVLTPMVKKTFESMCPEDPTKLQKQFAAKNPLKRYAEPEEIANAVSFLMSDDSSYLNGHVLALEGGETIQYGM